MVSFLSLSVLALSSVLLVDARASHQHSPRAVNPQACFITGTTALPTEIINLLPPVIAAVTCSKNTIARRGIPDPKSGGISFTSIDFAKSKSSPLQFALDTFETPCDPTTADLVKFKNQLNVYVAVESGLRAQGSKSSSQVAKLKVPKFFLQFQIARITKNQGEIAHQMGKVLKNAAGASAAQIAEVKALAAI